MKTSIDHFIKEYKIENVDSLSIESLLLLFHQADSFVLPFAQQGDIIGVLRYEKLFENGLCVNNLDDLLDENIPQIEYEQLKNQPELILIETSKNDVIIIINKNQFYGWITSSDLEYYVQLNKNQVDIEYFKSLKEEYDAIIESSYDGIYITDGNGVTLKMNKACERIEGVCEEDVIGKHMSTLVDEGFYSESVTLKVLESQAPVTIMQKVKNGTEVIATGNPIFKDGEIIRVVTNSRDITDLNKLKRELNEVKLLTQKYELELEQLRAEQLKIDGLVASDKTTKQLLRSILDVAKFDTTVLIQGESGTGKEIFAKVIHKNSERSSFPMITVNCGAIPESLIESELFGYEKGSFTGASKEGKIGLLEAANKGTVFLDEIGELPLSAQAKMLRVLQEREILRVGGTKKTEIDIRIVAATNKNLEEMVKLNKFRLDLFYRLNVVPIDIPPLRSRKDDIIPLTVFFLNKFNKKYGTVKRIDENAINELINYDWPGNVRELENFIERAVVTTNGEVISVNTLINGMALKYSHSSLHPTNFNKSKLSDMIDDYEKEIIARAMNLTRDTGKAAEMLGVDRSTITRKINKHKLSTYKK